MYEFKWQATNQLRQYQSGTIIAASSKNAYQILFNKGLQQIKLQRNWNIYERIKLSDMYELILQLSTLLDASIPLKPSLTILLDNCSSLKLHAWLTKIISALEQGFTFSQALSQADKYFTVQDINLIKIGEITGQLATVTKQIGLHKASQLKLQQKIQKIMFYPCIVLVISLILTALLLIFIVPQFADIYTNNQAQLPTFTLILVSTSEFLRTYLFQLLGLIALLFILYLRCYKYIAKFQQKLLSKIPILGKIKSLAIITSFCQHLHLMLNAGITLEQALQTFTPQNNSHDSFLANEVKSILAGMHQGYCFSECLSSKLFPIQIQQMLTIAEKSGQLNLMLKHIISLYQDKLNHQIEMLSKLLEPILMLIIGLLIGSIMLGMYLPIFDLGNIL